MEMIPQLHASPVDRGCKGVCTFVVWEYSVHANDFNILISRITGLAIVRNTGYIIKCLCTKTEYHVRLWLFRNTVPSICVHRSPPTNRMIQEFDEHMIMMPNLTKNILGLWYVFVFIPLVVPRFIFWPFVFGLSVNCIRKEARFHQWWNPEICAR